MQLLDKSGTPTVPMVLQNANNYSTGISPVSAMPEVVRWQSPTLYVEWEILYMMWVSVTRYLPDAMWWA